VCVSVNMCDCILFPPSFLCLCSAPGPEREVPGGGYPRSGCKVKCDVSEGPCVSYALLKFHDLASLFQFDFKKK